MLEIPSGQVVQPQPIPADGRVELMFSFAAGSRRVAADGSDECVVQAHSFLLGARGQGYLLNHMGVPHYIAVRFKPGGLSAFARLPLFELADVYLDLDRVWEPSIVRGLEDQLFHAPTAQVQAAILDRALLGRLNPPDHLQRLLYSVNQLQGFSMAQSIPALADEINLSQKHFERLFARYIGFRPSLFARVARFQRALYISPQVLGRLNLGQLAVHLGYYDQAHFTRDFKQFSGSTPNHFFAAQHDFVTSAAPREQVEFLQDAAL